MAAGYGLGAILLRDRGQRRRICLAIGLSAIGVFLVIGSTVGSLPRLPERRRVLFRLLNQQKYPASPLYLLMTLGPAIACLPLAEQARGWFARVLATFGRVPMFYYLLHILAIHFAALVVNLCRWGAIHSEWYATAPLHISYLRRNGGPSAALPGVGRSWLPSSTSRADGLPV